MTCCSVVGVREPPDPETLRRVCGAFATGVAIVSTRRPDGSPCGLTVNSFASVSLEPPLVLWSLWRGSPSVECFDRADAYAISILAEHQDDLARRFATPGDDKFDGAQYRHGELGAPIIDGCVAHFECRPHDRVEAGDHIVYVWRVERAERSDAAPLAFHGGAFRRISELDKVRAA